MQFQAFYLRFVNLLRVLRLCFVNLLMVLGVGFANLLFTSCQLKGLA